ncbi:MAG: hypothetical protein PHG66_00085 [Candidatus Colwellbacteria bacterium]|nr:hypothetical protein [Candidatus Colwellbacteria bacterium]
MSSSSNNWEHLLRVQKCGGYENCNCFVGNEFMGFFIEMDDNEKNINEFLQWLSHRTPPVKKTLTVLEIKDLVSVWKKEENKEAEWKRV